MSTQIQPPWFPSSDIARGVDRPASSAGGLLLIEKGDPAMRPPQLVINVNVSRLRPFVVIPVIETRRARGTVRRLTTVMNGSRHAPN